MGDEQEGPYELIQLRSTGQQNKYMIVMKKRPNFSQVVIPDAGDGEIARKVCNLLNKDYKERAAENAINLGFQPPEEQRYDFDLGIKDEEESDDAAG